MIIGLVPGAVSIRDRGGYNSCYDSPQISRCIRLNGRAITCNGIEQ